VEPEKNPLQLASLPGVTRTTPRTAFGRWFFHGETGTDGGHHHAARPWHAVLWLTGVDYFSTLGYQPGIALLAAGALSPIATAILVLVTLAGALPVYTQVAKRSYIGQGSIAMLERLLPGWWSKFMVLALLGFAGTDFVITMTLSAADAAQHLVENPLMHPYVGDHQLLITLLLLALLAAVFLKGFGEAIGLAMLVGIPYLLLNLGLVARGALEISRHPEYLARWRAALDTQANGSWIGLLIIAGLVFPKLALGMSGFETGVSVMPLISGGPSDPPPGAGAPPLGRIRATRKLLAAAALIMSVMLLATSFITALLVEPAAYQKGGEASGRALAFLAHRMFGPAIGTIYDVSTILILWFAGASAMAGLLNLIPRYLPRFGMAPLWVAHTRPLVMVLFAISAGVTWIFKADVEAQGGAYATGVLVLILSAAVAVALAQWHEARAAGRRYSRSSFYFWGVSAVFAYTLVDNIIERPDGLIIASVFILAILVLSGLSRWRRATEFRVESMVFVDEESAAEWQAITGKKVNLVPLKHFDAEARELKAAEIRRHYKIEGPLAFLHVVLADDRSEFATRLRVWILPWGDDYLITVTGGVAIANTIAYTSELIDPISIFLGLTQQSTMTQAFKYLLWGEGETGIMVYQILKKFWKETPEDDVQPLLFLMSE
jgi:hypothetical protein